jgi:uncharacterized membrane protein YdjX (TVP38/TMEM64 family)
MRRINPIWLLIAFNVVLFLLRDVILPEGATEEFGRYTEVTLGDLGVLGYLGVLLIYSTCSFFFIPLLIPLNILCGALYGPWSGTAISIVGITLGCIASTISVRHVFTGMSQSVGERPTAQRILRQFERHGAVVVIVVRLAFIVPYLLQNIVLAVTSINIYRLTLLTAIGALPGAAVYSFLGAGLVQADNASQLALYLAVPLVLLGVVWLVSRQLGRQLNIDEDCCNRQQLNNAARLPPHPQVRPIRSSARHGGPVPDSSAGSWPGSCYGR